MIRKSVISTVMAMAVFVGCGGSDKGLTQITFHRNFDTAKAAAEKARKPMIIEFYADWSDYSDTLHEITFSDSIVISMSKDIVFVKIDAEEDTVAARRYGIAGYPTMVVTRPDGREIDRIWGFLTPNDFYNQVQLYLQGKETLEDYVARLEDEPDNPEYLILIGEKYAGRSQWPKAVEFYNRVLQLDLDNRRGLGSRAMAAIFDVHARANDFKATTDVIDELIRRFPLSPEAEMAVAMKGYYTALNGDERGALALFRQYLDKYPGGRQTWVLKRVADIEEKL